MYEFPLTDDLLTKVVVLSDAISVALRDSVEMAVDPFRVLGVVSARSEARSSEVSEALGFARSTAASHLSALASRGYIEKNVLSARYAFYRATSDGERLVAVGRRSIGEVFDDMLSACTKEQRDAFDIGCIFTAATLSRFSYAGGEPDRPLMYCEAVLTTERLIIKTTQKHGLSLTDFRILFHLLTVDGYSTVAEISKCLLISRSNVSERIGKLSAAHLVSACGDGSRIKGFSLKEEGAKVASLCAEDVDRMYVRGVRSTQEGERKQYLAAARSIVARQRRLRSC